jgi:hypothetical protein
MSVPELRLEQLLGVRRRWPGLRTVPVDRIQEQFKALEVEIGVPRGEGQDRANASNSQILVCKELATS